MTVPTGNGEARGLESAPGAGNPAPSRPARARANDAKSPAPLAGGGDPCAQGGFGTEDMTGDTSFMSGSNQFWSQAHSGEIPPDFASIGNGGEAFGGS